MWKIIAVLAVLLGVLAALESKLSSRSDETRRASSQVRQLIPPEKREGKLVAVLRLEDPIKKETHVYARQKESWKCLSRFGAPCDEGKIRGLLDQLFSTQGIVQSRTRGRAGDYGLAYGSALVLSLHGPNAVRDPAGDRIAAIEVGSSAPGGGGCYVRIPGIEEVIAIDADLRGDLAPPPEAPGLPPLVDPHVVPAGWPGGGGIDRIRVERDDGERFELVRREKKLDPSELKAGGIPWDWFLVRDGKEEAAGAGPSNSFTSYLRRAVVTSLVEPKAATDLGLDRPASKLVLSPTKGDACEIAIGRKGPGGGVPARNSASGGVFEVTEETARLLAPAAKDLLAPADGQAPNPWDAAMKRAEPQGPGGFPAGFTFPGR
jgi:hypothetical protein